MLLNWNGLYLGRGRREGRCQSLYVSFGQFARKEIIGQSKNVGHLKCGAFEANAQIPTSVMDLVMVGFYRES